MKKYILIFLFAPIFAFSQNVEVKNPRNVLVDGVDFGSVADCIANHKQLASKIQISLENAWKNKDEKIDLEKEILKSERDSLLNELNSIKGSINELNEVDKENINKGLKDKLDKIVKESNKSRKQKELESAIKQKEELEKKIIELNK